jgi:high-affinity iron transporter
VSRWAALACAAVALAVAVAVAPAFARVAGQRGPDVVPVPALQLDGPMMAYRAYVRRLFSVVERQLATLSDRLRAGDVAGAESAWLAAHLS